MQICNEHILLGCQHSEQTTATAAAAASGAVGYLRGRESRDSPAMQCRIIRVNRPYTSVYNKYINCTGKGRRAPSGRRRANRVMSATLSSCRLALAREFTRGDGHISSWRLGSLSAFPVCWLLAASGYTEDLACSHAMSSRPLFGRKNLAVHTTYNCCTHYSCTAVSTHVSEGTN